MLNPQGDDGVYFIDRTRTGTRNFDYLRMTRNIYQRARWPGSAPAAGRRRRRIQIWRLVDLLKNEVIAKREHSTRSGC